MFIDDIFFIWTGNTEQLIEKLGELTQNTTQLNWSIKFQKPVFLSWIQTCISRTTNFTPKYIKNKPIDRASFI